VAPELLEEQGFVRMLENLMNDGNAMVLSNTVAALAQISESKGSQNIINLNPHTVQKLLTALGECTEWGQIYILEALIHYIPSDPKEAEKYF
jgi:vesicle coat complex subunit